ncbi:MAG: phage tail protein [Cyanobacteria bacterium J06628_3]
MPNAINNFPEILTNSRFYIELSLDGSENPVDAYFTECKGFKHTQEVIEVCEVTPQRWGKAKHGQVVRTKVPGNIKTNNITLRRGMTQSQTIWKWFNAVQTGNWGEQRRNGSFSIYNQEGKVKAKFDFFNAWPTNYIASDLDASSTDLAIEEIEMVVEMFTRKL